MIPGPQIRIMTVDDHPIFSDGLSVLIQSQPDMLLIAQATTALEALKAYRRLRPHVTVMDQRLAGESGTKALIAIRAEFSTARIMMLTMSSGKVEIQRALKAGAAAYALKTTPIEELLRIIRTVAAGGYYLTPEVEKLVAEQPDRAELTARELEVLELIRDGHKNKRIALKLAISETTVNFHIRNIVAKLHASDRAHAVMIALQTGLLQV